MTATVIGCVWGAHRALVEQMGDDAPTYDWCETEWTDRLRKTAPGDRALPDWLRAELFWAWRKATTGPRPGVTRQLSMFEHASAVPGGETDG